MPRKQITSEQAQAAIEKWITIRNAEKDTAEIDIDGIIGEDFWGDSENTTKAIKNKLKDITNIKAKKIIVNINSMGGSVNHGLGIHDALASHKAEVITRVNGLTASAATIIAQAGSTREMSDNALYLIHQPWSIYIANVTELEESLEDLRTINNRLLNIYVKRSGKDEDEIRSLMDENSGNGKWIDADEAKEIGLIDEVFEPMNAAAAVKSFDTFCNLPGDKLPNLPLNYKNDMTQKSKKLSVAGADGNGQAASGNGEAANPDEEKFLQGMLDNLRNFFSSKEKKEEPKKEEDAPGADAGEEKPKGESKEDEPKGEAKEDEPKGETDKGEPEGEINEDDPKGEGNEDPPKEEDPKIAEMRKELEDLKAQNAKYEGQLAKRDAGSTSSKIGGPEGIEGEGSHENAEIQSLTDDLKKLQSTWSGGGND